MRIHSQRTGLTTGLASTPPARSSDWGTPHRSSESGSKKRFAYCCQVALLSLGLVAASSSNGDIVERSRKALALRKELLTQYSVQVENQTLIDAPFGKQDLESYEVHYHGDPEQLRRDVLSSTRNGVPVDPSAGGRGGRGRRLVTSPPSYRPTCSRWGIS